MSLHGLMLWASSDFSRWEGADDRNTGKGGQPGRAGCWEGGMKQGMIGQAGGLISGEEEDTDRPLPLPAS